MTVWSSELWANEETNHTCLLAGDCHACQLKALSGCCTNYTINCHLNNIFVNYGIITRDYKLP